MYTERHPEANELADRLLAIRNTKNDSHMCSDGQSSADYLFEQLLNRTPDTDHMPDSGPYASYYRTALSNYSRNHKVNEIQRECVQKLLKCKYVSEELEDALTEDRFKLDSAPMSSLYVPPTFDQKIEQYRCGMRKIIHDVMFAYDIYNDMCDNSEIEPDNSFIQYVLQLHRSELSRFQGFSVHEDERVMGMRRSELSDYERKAIDSVRTDCANKLRDAHRSSVRHLLHFLKNQALLYMQPRTQQQKPRIRKEARDMLEHTSKYYSEYGCSSEELTVSKTICRGVDSDPAEPFRTMARHAFVRIRRLMCMEDVDAAEVECTRKKNILAHKYNTLSNIENDIRSFSCTSVHTWRKQRQHALAAFQLASHESIMLQHQRGYVADTSRQLRIEEWDNLFIEDIYDWMYNNGLVRWMDESIGGYETGETSSDDDDSDLPVYVNTYADDIEAGVSARARLYEHKKAYKVQKPKNKKLSNGRTQNRATETGVGAHARQYEHTNPYNVDRSRTVKSSDHSTETRTAKKHANKWEVA